MTLRQRIHVVMSKTEMFATVVRWDCTSKSLVRTFIVTTCTFVFLIRMETQLPFGASNAESSAGLMWCCAPVPSALCWQSENLLRRKEMGMPFRMMPNEMLAKATKWPRIETGTMSPCPHSLQWRCWAEREQVTFSSDQFKGLTTFVWVRIRMLTKVMSNLD